MNYYFLETYSDGTSTKVRPLPNQQDPFGSNILQRYYVSTGKEFRNKIPLGSIIATDKLTIGFEPGNTVISHYKAGTIWLMETNEIDTTDSTLPSKATEEIQTAFLFYKTKSLLEGEQTNAFLESVGKRTTLGRILRDKELACPTISESGFYVDPDIWYYMVRNLKQNVSMLLVGETGTGKSELVKLLAKRTGNVLYKMDMGTMHDAQANLLGTHKYKNGESKVFLAPFLSYIQQPKSIVLFDELNRAPLGTSNILLPPLDGGRSINVEISEDETTISVNETCSFMATANIGHKYNGTKNIDRALMDRFKIVELPQLDKTIESAILRKRVGIEQKEAYAITSLVDCLRNEYNQGNLSEYVSLRYELDLAEMLNDGYTIEKAFELIILPLFENNGPDGERNIVRSLIQSK